MTVFDRALCFAIEKHEGQIRRMNHIPYILHPMEVATIAGTITNDLDVLAATVLHDTIEDANVTEQELREKFGDRVADLVLTETEKQYADIDPVKSWRMRKEGSLQMLRTTQDNAVRIMWLADKLSNLRSFELGIQQSGDKFWEEFHQKDLSAQAWYYHSIAECLTPLQDTRAYQEFVSLIDKLFKDY